MSVAAVLLSMLEMKALPLPACIRLACLWSPAISHPVPTPVSAVLPLATDIVPVVYGLQLIGLVPQRVLKGAYLLWNNDEVHQINFMRGPANRVPINRPAVVDVVLPSDVEINVIDGLCLAYNRSVASQIVNDPVHFL